MFIVSDIILRFIKTNQFQVVSDGDLDAVFATGLLIRALLALGRSDILNGSLYFPRAREIRGQTISNKILIELGPNRGVILRGNNLLIDHHPDDPRLVLYNDDRVVLTRKYQINVSVAGLINYIFGEKLAAPSDLIRAVDEADFKNYIIDQAKNITRAFLISRNMPDEAIKNQLLEKLHVDNMPAGNIIDFLTEQLQSNFIYGFLPLAIILDNWDAIYNWIELEVQRYEKEVSPVVRKLYNRSKIRNKIAYIIYDYGNLKKRTGIEEAIYALETENTVAFSVGITTRGFLVRVTTLDPSLNLNKLCRFFKRFGIDCSGSEKYVFLYFPHKKFDLKSILGLLLNILDRISSEYTF